VLLLNGQWAAGMAIRGFDGLASKEIQTSDCRGLIAFTCYVRMRLVWGWDSVLRIEI